MSIDTVFNFSSPADYSFDPTKVEVSGGAGRLRLLPISVPFDCDFSSPTGFTFDPNKTEFVGGVMRQKDQRPANATCAAKFTINKDLNWGNGILTGTLLGNAVVSGGKLNCMTPGSNGIWWDDVGNGALSQTGCIRFKYTPAQSGNPAGVYDLFAIGQSTGATLNRIIVLHRTDGTLRLYVNDSTGVLIHANVQIGAIWNPTGGTEYEFEFNFDCTAGQYRLFINGTLYGSVLTGTCTRVGGIGRKIVFGNDETFTYPFLGYFDEIELFSTVQHTVSYVPGYTIPETIYATDAITYPEYHYTGAGTLLAFDSFVAVDSGAPHYTLQVGQSGIDLWWDGVALVPSNGTYAQSNTAAELNAHAADFDILGEVYGLFKSYWLGSNVQQSIDNATATVTGQQYPIDNPSIDTVAPIRNDGLDGFVTVTSGAGAARYILRKGTAWTYWTGTAWAPSDGTYAQSNTAAEILANCATFASTANDLTVRTLLHSDGIQAMAIDTITVSTNFSPVPPSEAKVLVWIFGKDVIGNGLVTPVSLQVKLNKDLVGYHDDILLDGRPRKYLFVNGYIELDLFSTDFMEAGAHYLFTFNGNVFYRKTVPASPMSCSLLDLPDYEA